MKNYSNLWYSDQNLTPMILWLLMIFWVENRVVKNIENGPLDLASNYEVFSRVSLENASKIEGF